MAYFPLFIELSGQKVLIIGGGNMALAKARKLADYDAKIIVIAPVIRPELDDMPEVHTIRRSFAPADLEGGYVFVIAATDDNDVNREAARLCRKRRIPVNVVDTQEECSFIFPSLVRRGPLSIGISTGGASPAAAVRIKEEIDKALPESTEDILLWLRSLRESIRQATESEAQRKSLYQALLAEALRLDRPLTEEETNAFIQLS